MMRRLLALTLFYILSSLASYSQQADSAYKALYTQFVNAFYKYNGNYYAAINDELKILFNGNNKLALKARNELKSNKGLNDSLAAITLANKLVFDLVENHFYDDFKDSIDGYLPIMKYAVSRVCPCIEEQYKTLKEHEPLTAGKLQPCIAIIQADGTYRDFMMQHFTGRPTIDVLKFGQLVSKFLVANCEKLRSDQLQNAATNAGFDWYNSTRKYLRFLPNQAIGLFERKSFDSLQSIFPAYKNFAGELSKAVKLNANGGMYWDIDKYEVHKNGSIKYVMSSKDSPTKVYGKVECNISEDNEAGFLTSFSCSFNSSFPNRERDQAPPQIEKIGSLPN